MKTALECIPCLVRQAAEAIALSENEPARREKMLRRIVHALASANWRESPPALAQQMHRIIRSETGKDDPYRSIKERLNRAVLKELSGWRGLISKAEDAREALVRLAAAGNLLDSAAKTGVQPEDLPRFSALWTKPLAGDPQELFRLAAQASRILYLADNAGEIVFDRLLIEALPADKVTLAVRGAPVLNDALVEDAEAAGITQLVPVITNGSDAPGTLLNDCSKEFLSHFRRADLILAKGQGNYESLADTPAPIIFLFTVKCPLVASHVGQPVGSLVVTKTRAWSPAPPQSQPFPSGASL